MNIGRREFGHAMGAGQLFLPAGVVLLIAAGVAAAQVIDVPGAAAPAAPAVDTFAFQGTPEAEGRVSWRVAGIPRKYFAEVLPALFERTLAIDRWAGDAVRLQWIFTGPLGGFTVELTPGRVRLVQRYYDSYGLRKAPPATPGQVRHPEGLFEESGADFRGPLRYLTVRADHRLALEVLINGRTVLRQNCLLDVNRHQLAFRGEAGGAGGRLLAPAAESATVSVDAAARRQRMLGFGGIAIPTAYHALSAAGRQRWWEMVAEYNLLLHREYPIGVRLNREMTNWDRLADAVPHYYGDNFANGEISDFEYNRMVRRLGGKVIFEFWQLPLWARRGNVADPGPYAEAMVRYCQVARDKAGAPPDIVGIQNEVTQPAAVWHGMTLALRQALDAAGFRSVQIHMQNSSTLSGGIASAKAFTSSAEVWRAIDYAASNMYDYQKYFFDPEGFDPLLREFRRITGDKPFLSTELAINNDQSQTRSYRVAFTMGQLYHKNLTLAHATGIMYCWTLLNVEQPSYGWTRTLMAPDQEHGGMPHAPSHQLRVFGAYSRRVREGMTRLESHASHAQLSSVAFEGERGSRTLVLLNRSLAPLKVSVAWPGQPFRYLERTSPQNENLAGPAPAGEVTVEPGEIVTLSNVALGRVPRK